MGSRSSTSSDVPLAQPERATSKPGAVDPVSWKGCIRKTSCPGEAVRYSGETSMFFAANGSPGNFWQHFPDRPQGEEWDLALSVKYDDGVTQEAKVLTLVANQASVAACWNLAMAPIATYYPNRFQKEPSGKHHDHNQDFESCCGWDCPFVLEAGMDDRPDTSWCWAGSYWWHLAKIAAVNGDRARLVQIEEGDKLGVGQFLETAMAEKLGICIVKIAVSHHNNVENYRIIACELEKAGIIAFLTPMNQWSAYFPQGHELSRGALYP